MKTIFRSLAFVLLSAVAFAAFAGQNLAVETRTFRLTYASAAEMAERLNGQMCRELGPDGKPFRVATAYEEANAVSVTASPETVKACAGIVADVDVKPKQVYVEARFVALNAIEMRNLGLKWNMLQNGIGIASANASAGISARKLPARVKEFSDETTGGRNAKASEKITYDPASKSGGFDATYAAFQGTLSSTEMSLLLQAFDENTGIKTFANPKVIVTSGKKARVDMTMKRPNVTLSAKRVIDDGTNTLDVDARLTPLDGSDEYFKGNLFFSFGVTLDVTPRVQTNGFIDVSIVPTVAEHIESLDVVVRTSATTADEADGLSIPYVTYPGLDIQRIITDFNMRSGETAVIGGLSRTEEQEVEDGIPYLRDIPWIGPFLFGSTTKRKNKVDIVLFVTVGEIDAEGPRGAVGAPVGAMNVVNGYPKGFIETTEQERSQSNER